MSDAAPPIPVTTATGTDVRVRFCPSPTGTPHVGLIRTALFNWAYARHTGGTFVFRIEDTDAARDSAESYDQLLDALTWMKLDWDEGVGVGGPHGPYRQSERSDVYADIADRLLAAGLAYESFSNADEIDARNDAAGRARQLGYDNGDRDLTDDQRAAFRTEGREPALRLRVPDEDIAFDDLVRGEVSFPAGSFSDFVIVRPNGQPLYTFTNPTDDALMGITHVLRGEDLMPSTPRQIVLYRALAAIGVTSFVPRFGHLPTVTGEGNKKLSKRNPESNLFLHREHGFVPEGLDNYLALLGWSLSGDRDVFTLDEMVEAFDVEDVLPNPARFDLQKAQSINGDHIRMLDVEDFATRCVPYLESAGVVSEPITVGERRILDAVAPLVQERVQLLGEVPGMVGFLFVDTADLVVDVDARQTLKDDAPAVLAASVDALRTLGDDADAAAIESALRAVLIDGLGLKPRVAFGALRVAVSGRRVSPPLFESMEILGLDATIARLQRLAAELAE